ncbi:unnamed protein product [Amoebophrya sp. A25]|nr:unnamed protein product [Amoebophrya sp. A25]|eukprot:GSA25T00015756001.1
MKEAHTMILTSRVADSELKFVVSDFVNETRDLGAHLSTNNRATAEGDIISNKASNSTSLSQN